MSRNHLRRGNSRIVNRHNTSISAPAPEEQHKKRATDHAKDVLVLSLRQEPARFAESVLPKTMRLADRSRRLIEGEFSLGANDWPYEDRLLAWLVPGLAKDVENFHRAGGPPMSAIFKTHQTEHLDTDLESALTVRLLQLYAKTT